MERIVAANVEFLQSIVPGKDCCSKWRVPAKDCSWKGLFLERIAAANVEYLQRIVSGKDIAYFLEQTFPQRDCWNHE